MNLKKIRIEINILRRTSSKILFGTPQRHPLPKLMNNGSFFSEYFISTYTRTPQFMWNLNSTQYCKRHGNEQIFLCVCYGNIKKY